MPKIKTRRKMGWLLIGFHWTLIICTVGLWTPVYLAARRRRVTITRVPDDGYAGPVPAEQGAPTYTLPQQRGPYGVQQGPPPGAPRY
ncbi:hypothetical protein [Streptomyces sp. ODS28]|uniref:hypothetical protein n=1 Tax=Streptomyces sp. ODS28 TaxID=3136688 RepID=UPI0031EFE2BD